MTADDLIERAKARAVTPPTPDDWGYRVALDEDDVFVGRWRGETTDEGNDNRRIFLLWDHDAQPCFSRTYAALAREIDRAAPQAGDRIVIVRGPDYTGAQGTGYSFGVETEKSDEPLPDVSETLDLDEIPF